MIGFRHLLVLAKLRYKDACRLLSTICFTYFLAVGSRLYKQKIWSEKSMVMAYRAVTEKGMSVWKASSLYSIPKSTLGNRVSGRIELGATSGPCKYLTQAEEGNFFDWLR